MFNIKLIAGVLVLAGAVFVTWHYIHTLETNKMLRALVSNQNNTIGKLDDKLKLENDISKDNEAILKEIRNAPKENDAPVSVVLDDAIDAIDGLRRSKSR